MLIFNSQSKRSLFSIDTSIYANNKHWWLTGFLYNVNLTKHLPYSRNLHMKASINFNYSDMAKLFAKNLKCTGLTKTAFKTTVKAKTVYIEWISRYNKI